MAKASSRFLIDGQTYQLSKPAENTVKLPTFDRCDLLRKEVEQFIRESIKADETVRWDLDYLIQEIINDIESTVPSKLQAE